MLHYHEKLTTQFVKRLKYMLKGRYMFGNYSKQILNLKTDLVTNIGELLIV